MSPLVVAARLRLALRHSTCDGPSHQTNVTKLHWDWIKPGNTEVQAEPVWAAPAEEEPCGASLVLQPRGGPTVA